MKLFKQIKTPLNSLFTGKFLVSENWEKNWPYILYISLLAMVMISSSHNAEEKVHEIAKLRTQVKELSSEYTDTRATLMLESMKTKVVEKAENVGLTSSKKPPIRINTKASK